MIRDRARTVSLTQPLSAQCFRTERGALGASAVYCDCREERKIQPVCIKSYSASFLFASNTEHPENSSEVSALSLQPNPRSRLLHPLTPHPFPSSQTLPHPQLRASFRVPDDSSETSVALILYTSLLSSPSSPCGAWHRCPSHRQMEPTLTPLLARGDASRINA